MQSHARRHEGRGHPPEDILRLLNRLADGANSSMSVLVITVFAGRIYMATPSQAAGVSFYQLTPEREVVACLQGIYPQELF